MIKTVAALLADQHRRAGDTSAHQGIKKRLADAETRLRRLREAIEAGAHLEALVGSINDAQAQRAAACAELDAVGPTPDLMSDAEVYARLDALSDIKTDLNRPRRLRKIYADVRLEMVYDLEARAVLKLQEMVDTRAC